MAHMPRKGSPPYRKYKNAIEDVILQYTYPRIDAEVSKHRNHLLKSPFCVHPGTGECGTSAASGAGSCGPGGRAASEVFTCGGSAASGRELFQRQ